MSSHLRLLLWLRLRTALRGRGRAGRVLVLLVVLLALLPMAFGLAWVVGGATTSLASDENPKLLVEWVHVVFCFAYLLLVTMPVLGFGANEFYDITKLFHFPVKHRTVFVAQTIGLMAGGTVLFFLPCLVTLVVTLGGGVGLLLIRLVLLVLFLFHTVALGQLIQLAFLNLLRSRKFRELATLIAGLFSAGLYLAVRLVASAEDPMARVRELLEGGITDWLAVVPSFWLSAVVAPGAELTQVLVLVLGFLPLTALIVVLAASLQEKAFHGEMPEPPLKITGRLDESSGRVPFPFSRIPGTVRAMAGKELRLLRREPLVKSLLIHQFVFFLFPLFFAVWSIGDAASSPVERVLDVGVYGLLFVESILVLNLLGLDGPGVVQLLVTPVSRTRVLAGKVLAYVLLWGAVNTGMIVAALIALGFMGAELPATRILRMFIGPWSALLVLLGVGAVFSPISPSRLTSRRRGSLSRSRAMREGCAVPVMRMIALFLAAVFMLPVLLVLHVLDMPALTPLALLYAAAVLALGVAIGARILGHREERVIAALSLSQD